MEELENSKNRDIERSEKVRDIWESLNNNGYMLKLQDEWRTYHEGTSYKFSYQFNR